MSEQLLNTGYQHPPGAVADGFAARTQEREERELSPLATRSYPAERVHPEPDCGLRTRSWSGCATRAGAAAGLEPPVLATAPRRDLCLPWMGALDLGNLLRLPWV